MRGKQTPGVGKTYWSSFGGRSEQEGSLRPANPNCRQDSNDTLRLKPNLFISTGTTARLALGTQIVSSFNHAQTQEYPCISSPTALSVHSTGNNHKNKDDQVCARRWNDGGKHKGCTPEVHMHTDEWKIFLRRSLKKNWNTQKNNHKQHQNGCACP